MGEDNPKRRVEDNGVRRYLPFVQIFVSAILIPSLIYVVSLGTRLSVAEEKIKTMEQKIDKIEAKVEKIEQKVEALEIKANETAVKAEIIIKQLDRIERGVNNRNNKENERGR